MKTSLFAKARIWLLSALMLFGVCAPINQIWAADEVTEAIGSIFDIPVAHDGTKGYNYFKDFWLKAGDKSSAVGTNDNYTTVGSIINVAVTYLMWGAGLIFFALILVSGYRLAFMPDKERAWSTVKQYLTTGVVGLIIVFSAYWIVQIIFKLVGFEDIL